MTSQAEHKPRILIVGAGPTGLTAAVELARRGYAPRIVDRNAGPTPLSKAVGIQPHSLDLLEPSGATDRLLAAGLRIAGGTVHYRNRVLGGLNFTNLRHRFNFLLALPQSETEEVLAGVLAGLGVTVERNTTLAELSETEDAVKVALDDPQGRDSGRFDIVYGADGVRSTVRQALGFDFAGYTHAREWSIADAEIESWPYAAGRAHLFLGQGGDVGVMIPIGPNRFRAVSNTSDALARVPGNYRVAKLLRTDTFRIPVRQCATYQTARVFLGGDAAHVHSPVGGRGMNLGIEDACAFARRLSAKDPEDDLAGYTAERHPTGQRWIAASERVLRGVQATNPAAVALRNLALTVVGHLPPVQRRLLARVAGVPG
jgi:2-polyprenyl-6-methoxyphenol hydroxylase-like FAD-dependent oxidoreductase